MTLCDGLSVCWLYSWALQNRLNPLKCRLWLSDWLGGTKEPCIRWGCRCRGLSALLKNMDWGARILGRILTIYTSYDVFPCKEVPYCGSCRVALILLPTLLAKYRTLKEIWGVNRHFKSNAQNIKLAYCWNQIQPNFAQWQRPANTYRVRSKYRVTIFKIKKSPYLSNMAWPIGIKFGTLTDTESLTLQTISAVKDCPPWKICPMRCRLLSKFFGPVVQLRPTLIQLICYIHIIPMTWTGIRPHT